MWPSRISRQAKPWLVTSPIFYVNAAPHVGHLHSIVLSDTLHRWLNFCDPRPGSQFSTGTDEHGLKVQQAAALAGEPVQAFCDRLSSRFKQLVEACGADATFVRTTEPRHHAAVESIWNTLLSRGHIYKGEHQGWYSVPDEAFVPEANTEVRLDPKTSKEVRYSLESGHPVEWIKEENYKFRLSEFAPKVQRWLEENRNAIQPQNRYNEVMAFLTGRQVTDISVSRLGTKVSWGIPVPNDPAHRVYVWLDALTNYLTVDGYPWQAGPNCYPADYHVLGKDIVRFHAVYWPAFLMAADLPLPRHLICHAHWTVDKSKMSKSVGNVVDPFEMLNAFGADPLRYFLMREARLSDDADFSTGQATNRITSELVDQLGNLLSRSVAPTMNPEQRWPAHADTELLPEDLQVIGKAYSACDDARTQFDRGEFGVGMGAVMSAVKQANVYFNEQKPWQFKAGSANADAQRLNAIIAVAMNTVRVAAQMFQCVMPQKSAQMLDRLNIAPAERTWAGLKLRPRSRPLLAGNAVIFERPPQKIMLKK